MEIRDFSQADILQAASLARENYQEERRWVKALPDAFRMPDLRGYASNGLGVAALNGGRLEGFLCAVPIDNPFQIRTIRGAYSPLFANGARAQNRRAIYARMYEVAAQKWAREKLSNHAITLYAHDETAQSVFFCSGFGMHGMDAICETRGEASAAPCEAVLCEVPRGEWHALYPLDALLTEHFLHSPMFIRFPTQTPEEFVDGAEAMGARFFAAFVRGTPVAFIKVVERAETFDAQTAHVCGAFCLPEYRGKGYAQSVLQFAKARLAREGFTRLVVDFERFNPTAYGFWSKHFSPFTAGVVRRVDEGAL